jgi:Flp pilus assembly protein TadG
MNTKRAKHENGQALILIVLSIVALVAITGLAVDGGIVYASRRQAQNAADSAAMAGALARIQAIEGGVPFATPMTNAALERAASNGYDNDGTNNTVQVFNPPTSGYYSDCGNPAFDCTRYVQVIITSQIRTFFAPVVGINIINNQVQAVALSKGPTLEPPYEGNALVSLKPTSNDCSGDFILGGSGEVVVVGGGIFVNSNNDTCAFVQDGCNVTLDATGSGVTSVGALNLNLNCLNNLIGTNTSGADPVPYPPEYVMPEPPECSGPNGSVINDNSTNTSVLEPGSYNKFPPANANKDHIILQSGVYCVDYIKESNSFQDLTGHNVFIYIRPGGYFSFQGGMTVLTAMNNGDYEGLLIYVASNFTGAPENCVINGNATDTFTGTIYAPHCDITINGNSNPAGFMSQIIGYEVKLNGSTLLRFVYDPDDGWKVLVPPKLGIFK